MSQTNYLRFHRKKWALKQSQLAHLIGAKARSVISDHESGAEPGLRQVLAYQLVFGVKAAILFPRLAAEVEDGVMRRAAELDQQLRNRSDSGSARTLQLLQEMISRADNRDGV